ncbi:MAG TPA: sulfatase [Planctomycetota bacterium]|nr:sulfatase [Planctomycetota bacterium]
MTLRDLHVAERPSDHSLLAPSAALLLLLLGATGCGRSGEATPPAPPAAASPAPTPPNVLIWLVDTLRADRLGCYGADRATSPHYDALAAGGVLVEDCFAASNWTQPSVLSILSGTWPLPFPDDFSGTVPPSLTLGAEWYWEHGWDTAGITVTAAVARVFGFDQGCATYEELDEGLDVMARKRREGERFSAGRVVDAALDWLDHGRDPAKPFYLYLHTVEPHMPYEAHPGCFGDQPSAGRLDGSVDVMTRALAEKWELGEGERTFMKDRYDGEVQESDRHFGDLMAGLAARGLLDDTLLVFVADHGDEHWEHGTFGHGHRNLHEELLHVPLVLSWPGRLPAGARVPGPARAVDIMPTLVDLCGLSPLPGAEGRSVAEVLRSVGSLPDQPRFADRATADDDLRAVRTGRWLLTVGPRAVDNALYDLATDPGELHNLVDGRHPPPADLLRELGDWQRAEQQRREALTARPAAAPTPADIEALQALGYAR